MWPDVRSVSIWLQHVTAIAFLVERTYISIQMFDIPGMWSN